MPLLHPEWTLEYYIDLALQRLCIYCGVTEEECDTSTVATTPEPLHDMATTPESSAIMIATSESPNMPPHARAYKQCFWTWEADFQCHRPSAYVHRSLSALKPGSPPSISCTARDGGCHLVCVGHTHLYKSSRGDGVCSRSSQGSHRGHP